MDVCQWVEKSKIQLWRVVAFSAIMLTESLSPIVILISTCSFFPLSCCASGQVLSELQIRAGPEQKSGQALSKNQGRLNSKTNQKNQGCQILFQMMGYRSKNKCLLRSHHLIFGSGFQAKNEWISLWELTHFLNALHPAPKTITFKGRKNLIHCAFKKKRNYRYKNFPPKT